MNINAITSGSIQGGERNSSASNKKKTSLSAERSSEQIDKLEISEEAILAQTMRLDSVREKIKSGLYENSEVLKEVAQKLYAEIVGKE